MIFTMVDDLRAALQERRGERVYGDFLQLLDLYARSHFRFEEECLDRYPCPAARENLQAHGKFIEVLAGFTRRHAASGFDLATAGQLADIVDDWLSGHICHVDIQLTPSVERT